MVGVAGPVQPAASHQRLLGTDVQAFAIVLDEQGGLVHCADSADTDAAVGEADGVLPESGGTSGDGLRQRRTV